MSDISSKNRGQAALLPATIEGYAAAAAPVRVIGAFVNGLDASGLGFGRAVPALIVAVILDPSVGCKIIKAAPVKSRKRKALRTITSTRMAQ
jgi:hypothetical protein